MLNLCATFLCAPLRWSTLNPSPLICFSQRLSVRWQTPRSSAIACISTPKLTPSTKNFIALIRSSAAIRSPFPAARGCRTFLLVKAALLPWPTAHSAMPSKQQVPFPFFVVPALGADFGVSAPGFYAAIPFWSAMLGASNPFAYSAAWRQRASCWG